MKKPREAVGVNSVKGRVRGVQEGQKQGGRKVSGGEMMTFITQGGEDGRVRGRRGKLRKAKAEALKRGASRALMRQVGEEGCWERLRA